MRSRALLSKKMKIPAESNGTEARANLRIWSSFLQWWMCFCIRNDTCLSHKERIPRFKGHKLVEVEQNVEESARQRLGAFEVCQSENALLFRLYHVMHLAEDILKQHRLVS